MTVTFTFTKTQPAEPWTTDRLLKVIESIPPQPLNGATSLYVHPDRRKDAERINEAAGGCLHIQLSLHASKNVIAGFKGDDCVLIIGTEKS